MQYADVDVQSSTLLYTEEHVYTQTSTASQMKGTRMPS